MIKKLFKIDIFANLINFRDTEDKTQFYDLSYCYIGTLGILIVYFVATLTSLFTGKILFIKVKYRSSRKSGLTPNTTKARVVRYAIIQTLQWFLELTHSSSEASN